MKHIQSKSKTTKDHNYYEGYPFFRLMTGRFIKWNTHTWKPVFVLNRLVFSFIITQLAIYEQDLRKMTVQGRAVLRGPDTNTSPRDHFFRIGLL